MSNSNSNKNKNKNRDVTNLDEENSVNESYEPIIEKPEKKKLEKKKTKDVEATPITTKQKIHAKVLKSIYPK